MNKHKVVLRGGEYEVQPWHKMPSIKELGGSQRGPYFRFPRQRWVLKRLIAFIGAKNLAFSSEVLADYKSVTGYAMPDVIGLGYENQFERDLFAKFKSWQKQVFIQLMNTPYRGALVNMDPGLGKTFTSIATAHFTRAKRILVVAPLSFLPGWKYEISKWLDQDSHIAHQIAPVDMRWNLTNPNTVLEHFAWFKQPWDLIIIDESLDVKNRKSNRFKLYKQLKTKRMWLLSGSPISKWADDLWTQLHLIAPKSFPSYWRFANTYCVVTATTWGDKVIGNKQNIDLRDEFKDLMITVKEHELGLDKPEMLHEEVIVPLNPRQREAFDTFKADFITVMESGYLETATVAAQLTLLQQIVSHPRNVDPVWSEPAPKLETLIQLYKEGRAQSPSIIWVWWRETGNLVYEALKKAGFAAGIHTGSQENPANAIELFKQGKITHLVISLSVGKYGHTFNHARSAIYYDRTFDMDAMHQSQQRILGGLRGTTVTESPTTFTLKSPGTTDSLLEENLTEKAVSLAHVAQHDLLTMLRSLTHAV